MVQYFDVEDLALFISMHKSADCLMAADYARDHPEDISVQLALCKFTMWLTNNDFKKVSRLGAKRLLDIAVQSRNQVTLGIGHRHRGYLVANCLISIINPNKGYIRFSHSPMDEDFYKRVANQEIFELCRGFLRCFVAFNTIHTQRLEVTRIIKNGLVK